MPDFLDGGRVSWMEFIKMPAVVGRLNVCCCFTCKCPLLFGILNNFKHFIKNAVSNTIFMVKEWN
jgi:hypothetical protein